MQSVLVTCFRKPHLAMLVASFFIATIGLAAEPEHVDVCTILQNLGQWNGKMVEVTGPIMTTQNFWIMNTGCARALEIKGTTFPSGFVLTGSSNRNLIIHNVNFRWDEQSAAQLVNLAEEARLSKRRLVATVVGMFETRTPIASLIDSDAAYKYKGFGHMGGAPGQIIVKTVKDMRIVDEDPLGK